MSFVKSCVGTPTFFFEKDALGASPKVVALDGTTLQEHPLNPPGKELEAPALPPLSSSLDSLSSFQTNSNCQSSAFEKKTGSREQCQSFFPARSVGRDFPEWHPDPDYDPAWGTPKEEKKFDGKWSNQTLWKCGTTWERHTFYDEEGNPLEFPYAFTRQKSQQQIFEEIDEQIACEMLQTAFWDAYEQGTEEEKQHRPGRSVTASPEEQERGRKRRLQKAAERVSRYVNTNYLFMMWTFSFALDEAEDMKHLKRVLPVDEQKDRKRVQSVFNTFLTKFRRYCKENGLELRYIKVLEKHDSDKTDERKRGTYHIHLVTDVEFLDHDVIQKMWGYGSVWYDDFRKKKETVNGRTVNRERPDVVGDAGAYVSKYVTKSFDDAEAWGQRSFDPSHNLKSPDEVKEKEPGQIDLACANPGKHFTEDLRAGKIDKALYDEICALRDIDEVKTYDKTYVFEVQIGEKLIKGVKHIEKFNFRALIPGARVKLFDVLPY